MATERKSKLQTLTETLDARLILERTRAEDLDKLAASEATRALRSRLSAESACREDLDAASEDKAVRAYRARRAAYLAAKSDGCRPDGSDLPTETETPSAGRGSIGLKSPKASKSPKPAKPIVIAAPTDGAQ
jgi:hypothetical protein